MQGLHSTVPCEDTLETKLQGKSFDAPDHVEQCYGLGNGDISDDQYDRHEEQLSYSEGRTDSKLISLQHVGHKGDN